MTNDSTGNTYFRSDFGGYAAGKANPEIFGKGRLTLIVIVAIEFVGDDRGIVLLRCCYGCCSCDLV